MCKNLQELDKTFAKICKNLQYSARMYENFQDKNKLDKKTSKSANICFHLN